MAIYKRLTIIFSKEPTEAERTLAEIENREPETEDDPGEGVFLIYDQQESAPFQAVNKYDDGCAVIRTHNGDAVRTKDNYEEFLSAMKEAGHTIMD